MSVWGRFPVFRKRLRRIPGLMFSSARLRVPPSWPAEERAARATPPPAPRRAAFPCEPNSSPSQHLARGVHSLPCSMRPSPNRWRTSPRRPANGLRVVQGEVGRAYCISDASAILGTEAFFGHPLGVRNYRRKHVLRPVSPSWGLAVRHVTTQGLLGRWQHLARHFPRPCRTNASAPSSGWCARRSATRRPPPSDHCVAHQAERNERHHAHPRSRARPHARARQPARTHALTHACTHTHTA